MNEEKSDRIALFCRTAASLATGRTREHRALLYLKAAFELAGAKRVGVVWRRRDSLICLESEAFSDPVRRVIPNGSDAYDTFIETTASWREGTHSLETGEPGWYPPRFRRKGECYLFLPEGRAAGSPRLFLQSKSVDRVVAFQMLLDSLRPHWVRQRVLKGRTAVDPVTGVHSLPQFRRYLKHLCRLYGSARCGFALIAVSLDQVAAYNGQFGQLMENQLLRHFARLLRRSFRRGDVIGSIGGEVFIIVLRDATKGDAVDRAIGVRASVQKHSFPGLPSGVMTCSVGVTAFPEDGRDARTLLQSADLALSAARSAGEGAVVAAGKGINPGTIAPGTGTINTSQHSRDVSLMRKVI